MGDIGEETFEVDEQPPQYEENTTANSWFITQILSGLITLVTSYGWHCLLLSIVGAVIYQKYHPLFYEWRRRRDEQQEAALYHKNPDLLLEREAAIERARQRMQESYNTKSQEHAAKQKLREEEKRKEKIESYEKQQRGEGGGGRRVIEQQQPQLPLPRTTNALRPEYNPLMGDTSSSSGSCGWRPARRGRAGG